VANHVYIILFSKSLSPYSSSLGCKDISGDKQWLIVYFQPMSLRLLSRNETGATYFGDPEVCVTEVAMGLRPIASSYANEWSWYEFFLLIPCLPALWAAGHPFFRTRISQAHISLSLPVRYSLRKWGSSFLNPSFLTVYTIALIKCIVNKYIQEYAK
jgi:hypothetical protein